MNILKQRILVVASLGGALLCVNVGKACAEETLSVQEMEKTTGAQENPATPQQGQKANSICTAGPRACTEGRTYYGSSSCAQKSPRDYNTCSPGNSYPNHTCHYSGTFVQTCHVTRWQTNGRRYLQGTTQQVPICTGDDVISPFDDSTEVTGCI